MFKPLKLAPLLICIGAIGIACLAQVVLGHWRVLQLFQRLEWITYDWRLRVANDFHPPVSDKLGFVYIGDEAITVFDYGLLNTNLQFGLKWPRHIYGRVVRELKAQNAKAVGLDLFFNGRRPDHAKVPGPNGLPIGSDEFFQQELKQAGNVILGAIGNVIPHRPFKTAASGLGDLSEERDSDGVLRRLSPFRDYRIWDPAIENEAALAGWDLAHARVQTNQVVFPTAEGSAVLSLNPDGYFDPTELAHSKPAGGFVRLKKAFEDRRVWHMGIVLAARELNLDLEGATVELENRRIILNATNGLQRIIPLDGRGQFLIDWSLRANDKRLTKEAFEKIVAFDLLRQQGSNVEARFSGKLVTIGSTATGNELSDRGSTPLEKDTFLTSNYWNVANSVLFDRFIRPSSFWKSLLLIGLMGLGAAVLTWRLPALWASLLVAMLGSACVLLALFAFVRYRYLLPVVMPVNAALLTHFGLLTYQTFFEQHERRRVKGIFAKLVSPNVVNELLKAEKLSLIGAREQITVFFADVRGFTELTDRSHAEAEEYVRAHGLGSAEAKIYFDQQGQEVLRTVNLYLGLIADVIKKHEGTLDKYIGDCVMAFWGAPTPNAQHALACLSAAIDAQRAIHQLNQRRAAQNKLQQEDNIRRSAKGQPPLGMLDLLTLGTGINTGVVTVGLMGSDAHGSNYTVFGRDVNLASRLEAYSGRGRIIIGEATWLELRRDDPALAANCIPIDLPPTALKGFATAMRVFEVPWKSGSQTTLESRAEKPGAAQEPSVAGERQAT